MVYAIRSSQVKIPHADAFHSDADDHEQARGPAPRNAKHGTARDGTSGEGAKAA